MSAEKPILKHPDQYKVASHDSVHQLEKHMSAEKPILKHPDQYPTEEVIYSCIGRRISNMPIH